jgi:hypothetical protein
MLRQLLVLAAVLIFSVAVARAQGLLLPSPLPGQGGEGLRRPVPTLPGGMVAAPLAKAPIPTVGAAAAYPPLNAPARQFGPALPDNRLVSYRQSQSSPLATGVSLAGAVAGWLLRTDPRVQAYQQNRQFTGRYDASSVPRQARPDDLLR